MMDRLPSTVKDTDLLWPESKSVLAALLELYLHSEARETKIVICANSLLRKLAGISKDGLQDGYNQLGDYGLVTRKPGKKRMKGEKSEASEYIIHFDRLVKPLVKKLTFEDLYADELKSLETPISPATTTAITTTTSTKTTTSTTTETTIGTSTLREASDEESSKSSSDSFFNKVLIDAMDYEEDKSFEEDLEKRVWYAKWDNEDREEEEVER